MIGTKLAREVALRAQHLVHRTVRPVTLGVRGLAIDASDRLFLVRHSYVAGWHLPGGGVEIGESALEALTREMREEGHIEIEGAPALLGVYFNPRPSRRDHVIVYVLRDFRQTSPRPPNWEIVESGFFPLAQLPEGTTAATRARLTDFARGSQESERW